MDERELCNRGPAIGEPAPFFESPSAANPITWGDFKGRWLIILSHAEDLAGVFSTRVINHLLCKRRTHVLSLTNRTPLHRPVNILNKYLLKPRVTRIDDPDGNISRQYGINAASEEMKGAFVVDPKGFLRIKLYFPMEAERDFYEILKLVDALQQADRQREKSKSKAGWKGKFVVRKKSLAEQQ